MPARAHLHRVLVSTALLASGCSAQKEAFLESEHDLQCEIQEVCGEPSDCDRADGPAGDTGRCSRFRPSKADECLEKLEAHLSMVEEDASTCDTSRFYFVCEEALKRRGVRSCQISIN